ncbi:hypothetical protein B0H15DRAFT_51447 [Mycena belliarum]|uniref:Uncharacterized protein n=1 Tax=Mycena belliarum TaxID=1033014 RepID=A0AAD6UDG4_9AGAR|nr:hypothetical protein B0H15DRAFT_51447 [Mycena belliae]
MSHYYNTANTASTMASRSTTMPAIRRAHSFPSLDKPLASLYASSSKGLWRTSTASIESSASTIRPSASVESIPIFTMPDYSKPIASCFVYEEISPLTAPRPTFERAMTMPALACKPLTFKASASCELEPFPASFGSFTWGFPTQTPQLSPSVSSVESLASNGDTLAFPSTGHGMIMSPMGQISISILPAVAAQTQKQSPAQPTYYEREVVLTAEQERNPPSLPQPATLSQRIVKAYHWTLHRLGSTRRSSNTTEAVARGPRYMISSAPMHLNPKTLVSEVPLVVCPSPVALPLPKGPAPVIRPAQKARKPLKLVTEGEVMGGALCAGW